MLQSPLVVCYVPIHRRRIPADVMGEGKPVRAASFANSNLQTAANTGAEGVLFAIGPNRGGRGGHATPQTSNSRKEEKGNIGWRCWRRGEGRVRVLSCLRFASVGFVPPVCAVRHGWAGCGQLGQRPSPPVVSRFVTAPESRRGEARAAAESQTGQAPAGPAGNRRRGGTRLAGSIQRAADFERWPLPARAGATVSPA